MPDIDDVARSMLQLHGIHTDEHRPANDDDAPGWAKAPDFANDPARAAAIRDATRRDRERYLTAGLAVPRSPGVDELLIAAHGRIIAADARLAHARSEGGARA